MSVQAKPRRPISIVCVYNDAVMLEGCLSASFNADTGRLPESELITVDNIGHAFATAGQALMHGAGGARNQVVAFAHQDVFLHSVASVEHAAAVLNERADVGVLGACGIDSSGVIQGRLRDRVVTIGRPAPVPQDVDSLDEVLFMVRASDLEIEPLATDPELAWHAYAVEYGLRVRGQGRRACALDMAVTHNSLTANLERLDAAHAAVSRRYAPFLPVRTTCGVITEGRITRQEAHPRLPAVAVQMAPGVVGGAPGPARVSAGAQAPVGHPARHRRHSRRG